MREHPRLSKANAMTANHSDHPRARPGTRGVVIACLPLLDFILVGVALTHRTPPDPRAEGRVAAVFAVLERDGLAHALEALGSAASADSAVLRDAHQIAHALGRQAVSASGGGASVIAQCSPRFALGHQLAGLFQRDDRWIIEQCGKGQPSLAPRCAGRAALALSGIDWSGNRPLQFCSAVTTQWKGECYRTAAALLTQLVKAPDFMAICARMEAEYAAWCRVAPAAAIQASMSRRARDLQRPRSRSIPSWLDEPDPLIRAHSLRKADIG